MRILVVGDWHSEIHEQVVFNAFKNLGHDVLKFSWFDYFLSQNFISKIYKKTQNKFIIGRSIKKLNQDLIKISINFKPDIIFVYRGTHITADSLIEIKSSIPYALLVGYNNDDPFSQGHPYYLWREFFNAVPHYDLMLAYRHRNLEDFLSIGAKRVELLRSWYVPELHKPKIPLEEELEKYACDCIFIGHFEDDGRDSFIEELIKNNIKVKIFGPYSGLGKQGWDRPVSKSPILKKILPIRYLSGMSYVAALNCAPIALCFLSKLNRDTYTRRCFEIPAVGAALFSEYSDDLANLFIDGEEAVFFRSKSELVDKVKYYLKNKDKLNDIRRRGMERVLKDGHDLYSRMQSVLYFKDN